MRFHHQQHALTMSFSHEEGGNTVNNNGGHKADLVIASRYVAVTRRNGIAYELDLKNSTFCDVITLVACVSDDSLQTNQRSSVSQWKQQKLHTILKCTVQNCLVETRHERSFQASQMTLRWFGH